MSFAIVTQRVYGNNPATFDFSALNQGTIGALVYGIQQFYLNSGNEGGQLQNFGTSFSVASGTGVGHTKVVLDPQVSTGMNTGSCWADVAVLAWLGGTSPQGVYLDNPPPLAVGSMGSAIAPGFSPVLSSAAMSGFNLSFASDTSDLIGIGAGAGIASTSTPGSIAPVAFGALTGYSSFSGTVDTGVLAFNDPNTSGVYFALTSTLTPNQSSIDCTFPVVISNALVFLQSFYVQFDPNTNPDFDLNSLQAGAGDIGILNSGYEVTFTSTLSFSGEENHGSTTPEGGRLVAAQVLNTAATYLMIGLT